MTSQSETLSVALAHHWLVTMRGGEKVLAVLADLFTQAPIYTLLARTDQLSDSLRSRRIETSWLQKLSFIPNIQRKALPLLNAAARSLDATNHDVVICSDAATIKNIRTAPEALKLCYCYSPIRYVWDMYEQYYAAAGLAGKIGLRLFADSLRQADRRAAETVTAFIAISNFVADRIRRSYHRPSIIIYPPAETDFPPNDHTPDDYYLVVGEHVSYKRNDLAIDACTKLGRPLVVIGTGPLLNSMRRRAGQSVQVLGWQSDEQIRRHTARCRALLFCGEEDFGLVPVEAQAAGRPVIAYRAGGALETVKENCTGIFFDQQNIDSVIRGIQQFESGQASLWPASKIQQHARQFSTEKFIERFMKFYQWCLDHYQTGGPQKVRQEMQNINRDAFL